MKQIITAAISTMLLASAAQAATLGTNLVVNGDAETQDMTGWTTTGAEANPFDGNGGYFGTHSFTGAAGASSEDMSQSIDLSALAALIDLGTLDYSFTAQLQNRFLSGVRDTVEMSIVFTDGLGGILGAPPAATDPVVASATPYTWDLVEIAGTLPVGTREAIIVFEFARTGFNSTDAFADEISFVLGADQAVPVPGALILFASGLALIRRKR